MIVTALLEEMQPPVRNALRILIALQATRAAPARRVSLIPPVGVVREVTALAPRVVPVQILLSLVKSVVGSAFALFVRVRAQIII